MANESFTNAPISDKEFAEIKEDPKAPTSNASNDSENQLVDSNELNETLFQAENVVITDENPTLSAVGDVDANVQEPLPNTPNDDALHVTRDKDPKSEDKNVKRRDGNKVYGAQNDARFEELRKKIDDLQMEKEKLRSRLAYLKSSCIGLLQERAKLKARYEIVVQQCNYQAAVVEALVWMINWLRSMIFYK